MNAAHPVIWTGCSRLKGPLLDEESHVTSKQKLFNTSRPGPAAQGTVFRLVMKVE